MTEERQRQFNASKEIQYIDPRLLTPHPRNAHLRGKKLDAAVRESIKADGIRSPLQCDEFGMVYIGAGTRLPVALELGMATVPVIVTNLTDADEIEKALLIDNIHSDDTNYQRARTHQALKRIEEQPAKERQRQGAAMTHARLGRITTTEMLPANLQEASPKGEASELAAKMSGLKPRTAAKSLKILDAIDLAKEHSFNYEADLITDCMNKSYTCGYNKAVDLGFILTHTEPNQLTRIKGFLPAQWKWDVVTGCGNGCKSCPVREYAVETPADFLETTRIFHVQEERRQNIFLPFYHRNRLSAPMETDLHLDDGAPLSAYRILTCWQGDIFDASVDSTWREEIMATFHACASIDLPWRFLIRTCHPDALLNERWPVNVELGINISNPKQLPIAEDTLKKLRHSYPKQNTFITISQWDDLLNFTSLVNCTWIYLGDFLATGDMVCRPTRQQLTALCKLAIKDNCLPIIPPGLRIGISEEYPCDYYSTQNDIPMKNYF